MQSLVERQFLLLGQLVVRALLPKLYMCECTVSLDLQHQRVQGNRTCTQEFSLVRKTLEHVAMRRKSGLLHSLATCTRIIILARAISVFVSRNLMQSSACFLALCVGFTWKWNFFISDRTILYGHGRPVLE